MKEEMRPYTPVRVCGSAPFAQSHEKYSKHKNTSFQKYVETRRFHNDPFRKAINCMSSFNVFAGEQ